VFFSEGDRSPFQLNPSVSSITVTLDIAVSATFSMVMLYFIESPLWAYSGPVLVMLSHRSAMVVAAWVVAVECMPSLSTASTETVFTSGLGSVFKTVLCSV